MLKKIFSLMIVVLMIFCVKVEAATDWNNLTITATGEGIAPANFSGRQAQAMAKRAAVVNAYRALAEIIQGVQVNSETTVSTMQLRSDIINTTVSAVITGARIVDERQLEGGVYQVTMRVPIFGITGSLAEAVIPRTEIQPFPAVESQQGGVSSYTVVEGGENSPLAAQGNYTGLIIDCRGLNLQPVMSPVIKDLNGVKLYGHENLNYDLVISEGMVNYASNMSEVGRAGSNPLIIRAVQLSDNNSNPVVSVVDGSRILIENGASNFLNDTKVVFLR